MSFFENNTKDYLFDSICILVPAKEAVQSVWTYTWALSQRAAKLIDIDLKSVLVPIKGSMVHDLHGIKTKLSTSQLQMNECTLHGICQTAIDSIPTIKSSTDKKMWLWNADAFSENCCSLFFDVEDETFERKMKANTGRCLWISPARWLYWERGKSNANTGRCLWISPARWLY